MLLVKLVGRGGPTADPFPGGALVIRYQVMLLPPLFENRSIPAALRICQAKLFFVTFEVGYQLGNGLGIRNGNGLIIEWQGLWQGHPAPALGIRIAR